MGASKGTIGTIVFTAVMLAACGDDDDGAADTEPATSDSAGPAATEPAETEPADTEPAATGPAETEPAETEPTATEPAETEPAETEPVDGEPAETEPSDGGEETAAGDRDAFCNSYSQVGSILGGTGDPSGLGELLDAVDANTPEELASEVATLSGAARAVLDSGFQDFAPLEDPTIPEAAAAADAWVFDNCAFDSTVDVLATDYAFGGLPTEIDAGLTAFRLTNGGEEPHELIIVRKNDGVTASFEELIALPEAEAEQMTTYVGGTFTPTPGSSGIVVTELGPGQYIAVCTLPVGSVPGEESGQPDSGPIHAEEGMVVEFTVS